MPRISKGLNVRQILVDRKIAVVSVRGWEVDVDSLSQVLRIAAGQGHDAANWANTDGYPRCRFLAAIVS